MGPCCKVDTGGGYTDAHLHPVRVCVGPRQDTLQGNKELWNIIPEHSQLPTASC